jgi:acyl carrier protein
MHSHESRLESPIEGTERVFVKLMSTEIESQIRSLVASTLRVEESMIWPDASFADDLGADSLDLVTLVLAIEDRFQVDIHDEEAAEILTVEQMIEYVTFALALRTQRGRAAGPSIRT